MMQTFVCLYLWINEYKLEYIRLKFKKKIVKSHVNPNLIDYQLNNLLRKTTSGRINLLLALNVRYIVHLNSALKWIKFYMGKFCYFAVYVSRL